MLAVTAAAGLMWQRHVRNERQQRESHFISIHFLVTDPTRDSRDFPKTLPEVFLSSSDETGLMSPFPDGLIYKPDGTTFLLAEPKPRFVSLFRKDSLVADDKNAPHWESSGKPANKFPED